MAVKLKTRMVNVVKLRTSGNLAFLVSGETAPTMYNTFGHEMPYTSFDREATSAEKQQLLSGFTTRLIYTNLQNKTGVFADA